jgi:hypothetical protein
MQNAREIAPTRIFKFHRKKIISISVADIVKNPNKSYKVRTSAP